MNKIRSSDNNIKFTYQNLYDFIYNVITSKRYFVTNKIVNHYKNYIEFLLNQDQLNPDLYGYWVDPDLSRYWVAHNSIAFYNDDLLEYYIRAIAFNTYKLKSMLVVTVYAKTNNNRIHSVLKHKRFASSVYVNLSDIYNYMITNKDDLFNHMYHYIPRVPDNINDNNLIDLFCADKHVCLEVIDKVIG